MYNNCIKQNPTEGSDLDVAEVLVISNDAMLSAATVYALGKVT